MHDVAASVELSAKKCTVALVLNSGCQKSVCSACTFVLYPAFISKHVSCHFCQLIAIITHFLMCVANFVDNNDCYNDHGRQTNHFPLVYVSVTMYAICKRKYYSRYNSTNFY